MSPCRHYTPSGEGGIRTLGSLLSYARFFAASTRRRCAPPTSSNYESGPTSTVLSFFFLRLWSAGWWRSWMQLRSTWSSPVAALPPVSELGWGRCAGERGSDELVSINYSHLGNRPGLVIMVPVHLGVRSGLVTAHSTPRAQSTSANGHWRSRAQSPTDLCCSSFHALGAVWRSGGFHRRSF